MTFKYPLIAFSFFFLLLLSCGKSERVDTKEVKEALKNREIKRISSVQIIEVVEKEGKKDSNTLIDCFNQKDYSQESFSWCIKEKRNQNIKGLKIYPILDSAALSELEKNLLGAYSSAFSAKEKLYVNVQDLKNGQILFTQPIFISESSKKVFTSPENSTTDNSFGIVFIYYDKKEIILSIP